MDRKAKLVFTCWLLIIILIICQTTPTNAGKIESPILDHTSDMVYESTNSEKDDSDAETPEHAPPPPPERKPKSEKPNVIFIFADDLGYNDVAYNGRYHGSGVQTPNIDRLAAKGVKLGNYYVQHLCTPTRSQLLTGRYQIHTGLQHSNIPPVRPYCLPLDEMTLAQKLNECGYSTHMIGKWHLGHQKKECLPTSRGFDFFLGLYLGSGDHYDHEKYWRNGDGENVGGYDFHKDQYSNLTVDYKYKGSYSTHIFTSRAKYVIKQHKKKRKPLFMYLNFQAPHAPLQVPDVYRKPFAESRLTGDRQTIAAMIYCMDDAIGSIVDELKATGLYKNTVIIFSTDNGGAREIPASNWPYRGSKGTYWEGGLHGVAFVNSPLLPKAVRGTTSQALIHVSDWFPTIVSSIAGGNLTGTKPLDGYDVWDSIISGTPSPRKELLHNINPRNIRMTSNPTPTDSPFNTAVQASLRMGDWKILTGSQRDSIWTAPPESGLESFELLEPDDKVVWLFNISADPYEMKDVADNHPRVVHTMLTRLQEYSDTMVPALWPKMDNGYDPAIDGDGAWGPWTPPPELLKKKPNKVREHTEEQLAKKMMKFDKSRRFEDEKLARTERKEMRIIKAGAKLERKIEVAKLKRQKLNAKLKKQSAKLTSTERISSEQRERVIHRIDTLKKVKVKSKKIKPVVRALKATKKELKAAKRNIGRPTIKRVHSLSPSMINFHNSIASRHD